MCHDNQLACMGGYGHAKTSCRRQAPEGRERQHSETAWLCADVQSVVQRVRHTLEQLRREGMPCLQPGYHRRYHGGRVENEFCTHAHGPLLVKYPRQACKGGERYLSLQFRQVHQVSRRGLYPHGGVCHLQRHVCGDAPSRGMSREDCRRR